MQGSLHIVLAFMLGMAFASEKVLSHDVRLEDLRKTSVTSPQLLWAVSESAKIEYANGLWTDFFAHSEYLRVRAPQDNRLTATRLLEVLASLRHCRWDEARALAQSLNEVSDPKFANDIQAVQSLVGMLNDTGVDKSSEAQNAAPDSFVARRRWFPAGKQSAALNPFLLKKPVQSLCEKENVK